MKRYMIFSAIAIAVFSCDISLDDGVNYYQFTQKNYEFIPIVYNDIGKILVFKNQQNEEVKLEVIDYVITKEKAGGIGSSYSLHYYQNLYIELRNVDSDVSGDNCDYKGINISNLNGDYFVSRFSSKRGPDPCLQGGATSEKLEFPYSLSTMEIRNVNYNKVVTIFDDQNAYFSSLYNFDKVYFDFESGIIGFDDTENNVQYRIVEE